MLIQANDGIGKLDKEWIELVKMAKQVGIPIEEVREYLLQNKTCRPSCTFTSFDEDVTISIRR